MTDHQTRLARALAATEAAGIPASASFPPFLRALAQAGLPVRPLHFMSVLGLVLFLAVGLSLVILVFHWLALMSPTDSRLIGRLQGLGFAGAVIFGTLAGLLTAIVIRFQALRAGLPLWADL